MDCLEELQVSCFYFSSLQDRYDAIYMQNV
jgi:hypothetical protein